MTLFEDALRQAFATGNPQEVWAVSQEILAYTRQAVEESARWRFRANFGTEICQTCVGLHAGEGITATCYQMKRCYYDHLRATNQDRVVDSMLRTIGDRG